MKFWVELTEGVELAEGKWVQLLKPGTFKHALHGTITITPEKIQKFVENFKAGVRGTDLDIDYDHKMDPAKGKKAAGWIKDLQAKADGLFALVDWTDDAKESIKKKEYRYLSADFYDKWRNEEGKEYNDVLAGAGLTNRPFLKNMLPVNLTDIMEEESMDPELKKKLITLHKLSEDATDEQVTEAVKKAEAPAAVDTTKATVSWSDDKKTATITVPGVDGDIKVQAPEPVQASEEDDDLKKLAETDPRIAKLLSDREEQNRRLSILEQSNKLTEISTKLGEVDGLPPVVLTELREALVKAPVEFTDKVVGAIKKLRTDGFVPQGSKSGGRQFGSEDNVGGGDPIKQYLDACAKVKTDNPKLSETEAYMKVAEEQPNLYMAYEKAVLTSDGEFEEVE